MKWNNIKDFLESAAGECKDIDQTGDLFFVPLLLLTISVIGEIMKSADFLDLSNNWIQAI